MECLVLGSGGMTPLPHRHLNALLVRREGVGTLFDCGEATQVAMKRWHSGFAAVRTLAISHLHADHVLGIPGFLMARQQTGTTEPLTLIGPRGLRRLVEHLRADLALRMDYPLRWAEVDPADLPAGGGLLRLHEDGDLQLSAAALAHGVFCLGYRLEERERPGRFSAERARALGVPAGPDRGRLQRGEEVELPDGRWIHPRDVLGPARRGRICAFVTDTRPCPGLLNLVRQADVAFLEGMFAAADADLAQRKGHLVVTEAARAAAQVSVQRLVLMHISPRYADSDLERLAAEARAEHGSVEVGRDGARYTVSLPD
jgi:ribonuclease Z